MYVIPNRMPIPGRALDLREGSQQTVTKPAPEPMPSVEELYRELKPEPPSVVIAEPAPDPTPPTCSCVEGQGVSVFCEIHGQDVPF